MRLKRTPIALVAVALVAVGCGTRGCCRGSECGPGFDYNYSPHTVVGGTTGIAVVLAALDQNPRVHLAQVVFLSDFSSASLGVPPPPNFTSGPFEFQEAVIAGTPTRAFWVGSGGVMVLDIASMSQAILRQDVLSGTALGQVLSLPDGSRVVVPIASTTTASNALVMIEPSSLAIDRVTLPGGYKVSSVSPSLSMDLWSDRLYVALNNSAGVAELSLPGFTVLRTLSVGGVATDVQVGPDGSDLFATLPLSGMIMRLDRVSGAVLNSASGFVGRDRLAPTGVVGKVFSYAWHYSGPPTQFPNAGQLVDVSTGMTFDLGPVTEDPVLVSGQRAYLPVAAAVLDLQNGSVENACCISATVATLLPDGRVLVVMKKKETDSPLPNTIGILTSDLQRFEALYPLAAE